MLHSVEFEVVGLSPNLPYHIDHRLVVAGRGFRWKVSTPRKTRWILDDGNTRFVARTRAQLMSEIEKRLDKLRGEE